ncbi:MAG: FAD-dependent oxidoreductase, partial [bacterium]|nr:FAD-dependent oxidoreductase [bacterium]
CAFYLALAGTEVTVFEAKNFPGGMVSDAIPSFRLSDEDIKKDIERIEKLGVTIQYEKYVDHTLFREIAGNHDYIYTAVGAQRNTPMKIEGESLPGVMDALAFLSRVKRGERLDMGPRIAVIGGGNSAMDAARTAWRMIKEQDGEVTVLYRRTQNEMPADAEEIEAVLEEGIEIVELTSPVSIAKENGRLKTHCWKMKLGHRDHSGRRRPVRIEGADFDLIFDTVIPAIGQSVIMDFADELGKLKDNGETAAKNIFIGGDALRGAFNIITAVADGKKGALAILEAAGKGNPLDDFFKNPLQQQRQLTLADYQKKASEKLLREEPEELSLEKRRNFESVIGSFSPSQAQKEAARCLLCNDICNVCVSVCPNRANVSYTLEPAEYGTQKAVKQDGKLKIEDAAPFVIRQKYQVYNLADYCNECGNCNTFCPSGGAPYKEKPKVCITKSAFASEAVAYFIEAGKVRFKRDGNTATLQLKADHLSYTGAEGTARLDKANFKILEADVKDSQELSTKPAIEMKLLHDAFIGS